jgi:beta-barrel assembly-enhancing protease
VDVNGNYSDGQLSAACSVTFSGGQICIYVHDDRHRLIIWSLNRVASCEMNNGFVHLRYGTVEFLECSGEVADAISAAWSTAAPVKAAPLKASWDNRLIIAICAVFIFLSIGVYIYLIPWAGEKAASFIPIDTEIELGKNLSSRIAADSETLPVADSLVNEFAGRLDLGTHYPVKIHVLPSDQINAFALPGGNIFIYSGILKKMDSYEQLVALIGHEVSHVSKQHSLKSICRSVASAIFMSAIFGDMSGISSGILSQADQFRQLQYSRELELEADRSGVELMKNNSVDPKGMASLLNLLDRESEEMPHLMKYLSTHPETRERISHLSPASADSKAYAVDEEQRLCFEALKEAL